MFDSRSACVYRSRIASSACVAVASSVGRMYGRAGTNTGSGSGRSFSVWLAD